MLYRTGGLASGNGYLGPDSYDLTQGGLTTGKYAYTLQGHTVADNISQAFAYKLDLQLFQRDQISISTGISNNVADVAPEYSQRHNVFNYQGGEHPLTRIIRARGVFPSGYMFSPVVPLPCGAIFRAA